MHKLHAVDIWVALNISVTFGFSLSTDSRKYTTIYVLFPSVRPLS